MVVTQFPGSYPYLGISLVMLLAWGAAYVIRSRERQTMLFSSVLSTPYALASVFFVPAYWQPRRVFDFFFGVEDLIFSFATGGIAWTLATAMSRADKFSIRRAPGLLLSYFMVSGLGILTSAVFLGLGAKVMTATCLSMFVTAGLLLHLRPDLLKTCVRGGLNFGCLYLFALNFIFLLRPDFAAHWRTENLSGAMLFLVPLEEALWALGYGAVWPVFMAFAFRWKPGDAEDRWLWNVPGRRAAKLDN